MKKKSLLFFTLSIFFNICVRGGVVDYCFDFNTSLSSVHQHLSSVLSPRDKVVENESAHCLNVVVKNDMKEELYLKWIARKFKILSHGKISRGKNTLSQYEHCRLEVEEVSSIDNTSQKVAIAGKGNASESKINSTRGRRSSLLLDMGTAASLRIGNDYINVTCSSQNANRVFLKFALSGKSSFVSSSVTLERGKTLNIAEIVEDLNRKYHKVSLQEGVLLERTKGKHIKKYFLRIKE